MAIISDKLGTQGSENRLPHDKALGCKHAIPSNKGRLAC